MATPTPSPQPSTDPDVLKMKVDLSVAESEKAGAEKRMEELQAEILDLKKKLDEKQQICNEFEVRYKQVFMLNASWLLWNAH